MKKFDYIISAVAFCFGLVIFYVTRNVEKFYNGTPGSAFFPRIIAVAMFVVAAALAVNTFLKRSTYKKGEVIFNFGSVGTQRVLWMFLAIILAGISMYFFGFISTSLWFTAAVIFIMEERRPLVLVVSAILLTLVIYVIFTIGLQMYLPRGRII